MENGLPNTPHQRLIRKLSSIAQLSQDEEQAIASLPMVIRALDSHQEIVHEGDRPRQSCLVVEGWVWRYQVLPMGKRQILSICIPGDFVDLQSLHVDKMDHSIGTLQPSVVAFVPHAALIELTQDHPGLTAVLWRDTLTDGAIFRQWIVNLGQRDARERIAHLLCELYAKSKAVGLVDGNRLTVPLTQAELADATGMTPVHVNRVLQDLRRNGLIRTTGSVVELDWAGLSALADFTPDYLNLRGPPARALAAHAASP